VVSVGSLSRKTLPVALVSSSSSSPPIARASSRETARPSPEALPSPLLVTKGWKSRGKIARGTPGPLSMTSQNASAPCEEISRRTRGRSAPGAKASEALSSRLRRTRTMVSSWAATPIGSPSCS
jgi:hypothetical protein